MLLTTKSEFYLYNHHVLFGSACDQMMKVQNAVVKKAFQKPQQCLVQLSIYFSSQVSCKKKNLNSALTYLSQTSNQL